MLFSILATTAFGQKPTPSPSPEGRDRARFGEMRPTRIESISDALLTKQYLELKEEGFRIQLPGSFASYVPSKPASTGVDGTDGSVSWELLEATLTIMFGDLDAKKLATFTPEQRLNVLSVSLNALTNKQGRTKISERDLNVNGFPAKEVKFKDVTGEYLARDLFVGSRLFVFVAKLNVVDGAEGILKQALDTFEAVRGN